MLLASGSEQNNDANNSETNNTNNSETHNTNNPQENLSPEQEKAQKEKELSEAQEELADLEKRRDHVQRDYDKHNKRHAEAQDASDSEAEDFEVGFLENTKPYLDELEEELEKVQEHVQTLTDLINSLF